MLELFCKKNQQFLAVNFFHKKAPPQIFDSVPKIPLLPVKKMETNYFIILYDFT